MMYIITGVEGMKVSINSEPDRLRSLNIVHNVMTAENVRYATNKVQPIRFLFQKVIMAISKSINGKNVKMVVNGESLKSCKKKRISP